MAASPAWPEREQSGAPPAWAGDVSLGVQAWAGTAESATESTPHPDRRSKRRSGRGAPRGRTGRRSSTPPPEREPLPEADQEAVARKILLDQLTGQARTRKELADKLRAKEVPDELAAGLLDRFEEVGLIDDAEFARMWIASRQPGKGLARRALAHELRRKGIDDEVAKVALDEIDGADEEEAARLLVRKKLRSLQNVDRVVATRRLAGMLARKGYPPGVAFAVIREELAADLEPPQWS